MKQLLTPYTRNGLHLNNHIVMAPMTRCRAIGNMPNERMAEYYAQRSGAGLIVTEGVAPVPEGLGYARIPGIFSAAQTEAWKPVAERVHAAGSRIFMQLMHTGRIGHTDNLPAGTRLVGPSSRQAAGKIFTDTAGVQENSAVEALTAEGIENTLAGFVQAARNAVAAGFDGIELHGANGYLLEQFLHPLVNDRTDRYGGSIENRCRFILEVAAQISEAIGPEKTGIRFSPYSTYNDLPAYAQEEVHATYVQLAAGLDTLGIAYIHLSVNPALPAATYAAIREAFKGTIIFCNGLTPDAAEALLHEGKADLVAFGKPFVSNPDLVERIRRDAPLTAADPNTFYTADMVGYTDYPVLS